MQSLNNNRSEAFSLRINTQKFNAIPMKNPQKESNIVITTAKKSQVKTRVKCDRCLELINRGDIKVCNECGRNVCLNCLELRKGKHYCLECV